MEESKPGLLTDSAAGEARTLLWQIAVGGSAATLAYILLVVLSEPPELAATVAFAFAASLSVASIALGRLLAISGTGEAFATLCAGSNVIAAALLLAMALVQIAVKDVADPPDESVRAVYWGLDGAWDLYLGAGTFGFAVALLRSAWFARWAIPGIVVALALVGFNLATFPEPPSHAGLVDVGPLVGLWYFTLSIRAMFILRSPRGVSAQPSPE